MNKRIVVLLSVVLALFLTLTVYLSFFAVFRAPELKKSVYNRRLYEEEETVLRGAIYDRNGTLLAESRRTDAGQKRVYPYGALYAHVIGYASKDYGKSKLELSYDNYLCGDNEVAGALNLVAAMSGTVAEGVPLVLTVDHPLQQYASDLLGNKRGSIIVMDPDTGAIRAMVSHPDFDPDPDTLASRWAELSEREDAPFVSRATAGLYAPGSTWKILLAAKAIESGMEDDLFEDDGTVEIDGREFANSHEEKNGTLTLAEAFAKSSNVVFAGIGDTLADEALKTYETFLLGKALPFDLPTETSTLRDQDAMGRTDYAATAIGQGKLAVTPLYMATVASAVACGGEMRKPYLVERAEKNGITLYGAKPQTLARVISEETAGKLRDMMRLCVTDGTGKNADVPGLTVYGKTGTAQNETDRSHDWFVGFAEAEDGDRAIVAVILEYNGEGSSAAALLAGRVLDRWLD